MGIEIVYFAADADAAAAEAEDRPGGPLGWPVVVGDRKTGLFRREMVLDSLGPGFDGFEAQGYDPVTVEVVGALLRGVDFEAVEEDPRFSTLVIEEEDRDPVDPKVLTMTDGLQDALVAATDDDLTRVLPRWKGTPELKTFGWEEASDSYHLEFLQQLRKLAVNAATKGQRIYCYVDA